jgi:hypothetical protein
VVTSAAVTCAALAAVVFVGKPFSTRAGTPETRSAPSRSLPEPVAPAFGVGEARQLGRARFQSYWAAVLRADSVRSAPRRGAPVIGRVDLATPEGTSNIVAVLGRATDRFGDLWVKVRLPALPNNTVGWVPRPTLGGYGVVRTRLVVELERLTATLFKHGRKVFEAPVGVGRAAWPTPQGHFYIRNRLSGFASPAYGPLAFGTSARSSVLTDWPAGGYVGIHGTDQPALVPGRVSHGCIRMRNEDILRLGRLMPVGTPLDIQ